MSRLTLNSIQSLDAIQRQARTRDRHVKYRALNMQHNFHLRHVHSWHNMDHTVFMQVLCIPPTQPRYAFEWHTWFYQTSKSTMCGLQPISHREQRHVLSEHVQRLKTLFGNNRVVLHLSVRSPRLPRFTPQPRHTTRRQSAGALMTRPVSSLRPLIVPTLKPGLRSNPRSSLSVVFSIKLRRRNGWGSEAKHECDLQAQVHRLQRR